MVKKKQIRNNSAKLCGYIIEDNITDTAAPPSIPNPEPKNSLIASSLPRSFIGVVLEKKSYQKRPELLPVIAAIKMRVSIKGIEMLLSRPPKNTEQTRLIKIKFNL